MNTIAAVGPLSPQTSDGISHREAGWILPCLRRPHPSPAIHRVEAQAPMRVSFVGGGTDLPEYYKAYGGLCVSLALRQFNVMATRRREGDLDRNTCLLSSGKAASPNGAEKIVKAAFEHVGFDDGEVFSFTLRSDLDEVGSGLGASGSVAVASILAAACHRGTTMTREEVAEAAFHVERHLCGAKVGRQDQAAAAWGGFHIYHFHKEGTTSAEKVRVSQAQQDEFARWLLLVPLARRASGNEVMTALSDKLLHSTDAINAQHAIKRNVEPFVNEIEAGRFAAAAARLDQVWQQKRRICNLISHKMIDDTYVAAMKAGALGGKLLGAGAGGHMLLMAPPERHAALKLALFPLTLKPVSLDAQGARVLTP